MEPPKELVLQLIEQITAAFAGVSRQGGVSLHQTRVLDDAFSQERMDEAGARDVDTDWRDVPSSSLEKSDLHMSFLDPIGFRYYLPAYMVWQLKQGSGSVPWVDCNAHDETLHSLKLQEPADMRQWQEERFEMFTLEQSRASNRFLHFYAKYGEDFDQQHAQQALDSHWAKFDQTFAQCGDCAIQSEWKKV